MRISDWSSDVCSSDLGSGRSWLERIAHRFEAAMAWASFTFITRWGALERGYRRPYAKLALRLKFAFYPLLAIAALAWLGWDWSHARNQIGRAHVCTPVTNSHLVCRLLPEKKNHQSQ